MIDINEKTANMVFLRDVLYKNQYINIWRGKYSKKEEKLYSIGNMYFNTMSEAKDFLDNN